MALKKQDKNPVEIDETLQEQQYIDALVNKVSEAQKIYATYSQEQAVLGEPSGSTMRSALPWSAVTSSV